uniref:Uncharacterized protein n=1 Tax=Molossus molossus TaxID=27622 RepID=A0A7J8I7Y0_MOLMO|nr:hypothetical protein HJG59_010597 [Molossus molossus]
MKLFPDSGAGHAVAWHREHAQVRSSQQAIQHPQPPPVSQHSGLPATGNKGTRSPAQGAMLSSHLGFLLLHVLPKEASPSGHGQLLRAAPGRSHFSGTCPMPLGDGTRQLYMCRPHFSIKGPSPKHRPCVFCSSTSLHPIIGFHEMSCDSNE